MSKATEERKGVIKREPVTIRMNSGVLQLARSLARTHHGGEDKLGSFLEDAVNFFSAQYENEARASAILKTTEETLFRRFDDQMNSMYKAISERIGKLVAVSCHETALAELILKDIFVTDAKRQARYDELRGTATKKMKNRFDGLSTVEILELTHQNQQLGQEIEKLKGAIAILEKGKATAESRASEWSNSAVSLKARYNALFEAFRERVKLNSWYNKALSGELERIQSENSDRLRGRQTIPNAMAIFEQIYAQPSITTKADEFKPLA